MSKLTISIDDETLKTAKDLAHANCLNLSRFIRELIKNAATIQSSKGNSNEQEA